MANKIKGITIEIDGNTTGLTDALKDVNKSINSVNVELKDLEKKLKLDPGNTDLLAQKQELLSKKIAETTEKLKTLRIAKQQMDADIQKGNVSKESEQYRALVREISGAESELRNMKGELDNVNQALENGSKNSSIFADVLKADLLSSAIQSGLRNLVDLTKKLANSFADVSKKALNSYADFQQLSGGIEKLYGEEAAKIVQKNASESFKTVGISSNKYLSSATAFSAKLLSDFGDDTVKAAEYTDKALRQIADNANTYGKYTADELTLVYQNLAKGTYTTLDNLNLGYSGSKTGMEQLIKDAEKLSGKKFKIGNLADMIDAIQVIQDKLKITGTTSLEAGKTISGSVNSMKASWEDLLTGIADKNADIEVLMDKFVTTIVGDGTENNLGVVGNILPVLESILNRIPTMVSTLLPKLVPIIVNIIKNLVKTITENIPLIINTVKDILLGIVDIITDDNVLEGIIEGGFELMITLAEALVEATPKIVAKIPIIIEKIITEFTKTENLEKMLGIGTKIIDSIAEGIINLGTAIYDAITKAVSSIYDDFIKAIENKDYGKIGENIVNGIGKGMSTGFKATSYITNPGKVAMDLATNTLNTIKNKLGIHSPSKVFADEVGKFIPAGIAEGIENEIPNTIRDVDNAMAVLNKGIQASVNPTINPTANSNPLIIQIENFNNTRESDIEDLAEELEFYRKRTATAVGGN